MSTEPTHIAWEPIVIGGGYERLWFDGLNLYYGARKKAESFRQHFQVQPNVFDGFTKYQSYGIPLINPSHPDHDFAVHFAKTIQRGLAAETDVYLEQILRLDLSPRALAEPVDANVTRIMYGRVLNRPPSEAEISAAIAAQDRSGGALIRRLPQSDEFRRRRARIAI